MKLRPLSLSIATLVLLSACQTVPSGDATATDAARAAADTAAAAADAAAASADAAAASDEAYAASELEAVVVAQEGRRSKAAPSRPLTQARAKMAPLPAPAAPPVMYEAFERLAATPPPAANTENYEHRTDNPVHRASEQPVSTFSIDVDTGSYSNARRMLRDGVRPPADAVRAEEFLNYFDYGHPAPDSLATPFRVSTELAPAPWNNKRQLLMVGIKGYDVPKAVLPPANLVFLIDTSGSMAEEDKLPLLKRSFALLTKQLRAQDRVSIVVYAGSAGLVLPPTPGDHGGEILAALEQLDAGGSTNGGEGIALAYAMAKQSFVKGGINRVILATDGDFNVGTVDQNALKTLVGDQRKSGIALSTLGFGSGNYNDAMAEQLADVGDGQHAYIDSLQEANKVLVQELGSTLMTIARDVKIQIEFNPATVAEYRLIGYENRVLNQEDFANDRVDAGDIGAGHQVTALYEITPVGSGAERMPALRYAAPATKAAKGNELAHLRLRYKPEGQQQSRLIETPVLRSQLRGAPSESLRFASAVAGFADTLRGGTHMDNWSWQAMADTARGSLGKDPNGERAELVQLIGMARALVEAQPKAAAAISD